MIYYHSHLHHFTGHPDSSSGFWGALWGAFFAFLFGLLTYVITKRRERFIQHKNALVKLERVLNKHLDDMALIEAIIVDGQKTLSQSKVMSNRLFDLQLPDNFDMEIGSIDLINKFFIYRSNVEHLNFNSRSTNHALTRLEDLFINGQPVPRENFNFIKGTLETFEKEIPAFNKDITNFLILTRIHFSKIKDKNSFVYGVINDHWEPEISKEEIKKEGEKFQKEVEQVQKQSKEGNF